MLFSGYMRSVCWLACAASAAALPAAAQQDDAAAAALLKRADEVRFPADGFELSVSIRTARNGRETDARAYRVLSKGNENTLVMVVAPESERGQIMLMKGRDLWLFVPAVSQPVRLSLAQRLTGQVANGDIARANFAGDYAARIAGSEEIDGVQLTVLDLTAIDRSVTYQRVRYWVRQRDAWPYKAEFYSLSNRLLKTCIYSAFREVGGRMRPTRLTMTDALRKEEVSVMDYADIRARDLPDRIFTKEYLKKLE
jgi:outer membrane lipoprotein-sorting protein